MPVGPYERHVLVCVSSRPALVGASCGGSGAPELLMAFQAAVSQQGLANQVLVTGSTCLGPCEEGVNVVVYPEGVWYRNVSKGDVEEIVRDHLREGKPVARLKHAFSG